MVLQLENYICLLYITTEYLSSHGHKVMALVFRVKIKVLSSTSQVARSVVQLSAECKRQTLTPVFHKDGGPRVPSTETFDPCVSPRSAKCDLCIATITTEPHCSMMLDSFCPCDLLYRGD